MPRRIERRGREEGVRKSYQQRDNKKLRILAYLSTQRDGAAFNKIKGEGLGPHTQEHYLIQEIMEEMQQAGWVEQIPYNKRLHVYKITTAGQVVISTAFELKAKDNPLSQLDMFRGIVPGS